ncbi:response regulator transcription factor [Marinobacter sp. M216]|uniref:Response regulator transcription factor n=1 Tax=Marinobacter albus TaxID=3030833 RepID=A0ABT7HCB0_9GAMM|nr:MULTISPECIES: response regulator transcription factor [unclassified Marinobacter]MBW7469741.1 response regulator transcription factor [Marinobacter sp. F4218]MDK9558000.1 response regulator transcription factor [Marinobacter sp. M216]
MDKATIVLLDATQYGADQELARVIKTRFPLERRDKSAGLENIGSNGENVILCFEFDFPDISTLSLLNDTKHDHPSIPILMFTEQHSEALAVWALRARVWNYFVKPVAPEAVLSSLSILASMMASPRTRDCRNLVIPPQRLPDDARFQKHRTEDKLVELAVAHIEQHLHEKLSQSDIADRCNTTSYHLSRAFKQLYGITFQDYIMRRRLDRAGELLRNASATVSDVCWTVGFRDASYFSRMFHRHTGMTPSQYRRKWLNTRVEHEQTDLNVPVALRP